MPASSSIDPSLLAHVRLATLTGVGTRYRRRLLEVFRSPLDVFSASPEAIAAVEGLPRKVATAIRDASNEREAVDLIDLCRRRGVDLVVEGDPGYPKALAHIDDPPGMLFMRGAIAPCDALSVAVVGSRHASPYGLRMAARLAGGLARAGYTVVSGLARGIDAAAHRGALEAGGRTIAVLGTGVLSIYPPEHADLAAEVLAHGAIVSEAPPHEEPHSGLFPRRNRIISGLTLGTVVVEATERSGGLITARLASEQGREVFAVPGPADSRTSRGCHRLIRDGATLVESVDDILDELGPLASAAMTVDGREVRSPAELRLDDVEQHVMTAIDTGSSHGGVDIDHLVAITGLAASQLLATVGVLEMRRLIRRLPGGRVARL